MQYANVSPSRAAICFTWNHAQLSHARCQRRRPPGPAVPSPSRPPSSPACHPSSARQQARGGGRSAQPAAAAGGAPRPEDLAGAGWGGGVESSSAAYRILSIYRLAPCVERRRPSLVQSDRPVARP